MPSSDRKSTRLNSSHGSISYAVFCLKKKNTSTCVLVSSFFLMIRSPPRSSLFSFLVFFFFNDTATTEIYTLSLHDALPISRLNSSHGSISYAVFWSSDVRSEEHTSELRHGSISYAVFCFKNKQTSIR